MEKGICLGDKSHQSNSIDNNSNDINKSRIIHVRDTIHKVSVIGKSE